MDGVIQAESEGQFLRAKEPPGAELTPHLLPRRYHTRQTSRYHIHSILPESPSAAGQKRT